MHSTPDQRLLEWVRKFRADLTPAGTITRLELYHSVEGMLGERLATFEMADRDDDEDPDDLAQELWDVTEEDAATRPTGQVERYVMQAFRGDTREPDEQKAFTTRGRLVTALTGGSTEPPTEMGMRAGEMRRTNDLHALVVRMCEATAGSAAVQLQREREENNRLRDIGFRYEQLRQEQLDRSQERELEREDNKQRQQITMMLAQTLMQFAPLILQRLLSQPAPAGAAMPLPPEPPAPSAPAAHPQGPRPPPAPPSPSPVVQVRDQAIGSLLETLDQEQVAQLVGVLTPEQTQQFLGIYTSFRENPPAPPPSPASTPGGRKHAQN